MARKSSPLRQILSPSRIFIPIILGLAVVAYFVVQEFENRPFEDVSWTWWTTLWLFVALLMVAARDIGYMIRLRILTNGEIGWRRAFDVIMLWEFSSSITPSIVGGSGVAIFIIHREGLSIGRSTAVVMITAFLDELFYVLMVPIVLAIVGLEHLLSIQLEGGLFGIPLSAVGLFIVGYCFILLLILAIGFAIFIQPHASKSALRAIFSLPLLRRWKESANRTGDELIVTSEEMRGKPFGFWMKVFGATFLSWTARFWIVNFLILAFASITIGFHEHFVIYARQLVMWVILLISPTPGGIGFAEVAFAGFLKDFLPSESFSKALALLWRLMSYWPYLVLGVIILPRWIRRVYLKRNLIRFKSN